MIRRSRSASASDAGVGFVLESPSTDPEPSKKTAKRRTPARNPARPPKPPKPARSAEDRAAHTKLVDRYFAAYEACTGSKPPFGSREGQAAWKLLDAIGLERAEQAIKVAYSDEWGKRRSIRSIADDPGKFAGVPRTTNGRSTPIQPSYGVKIDAEYIEG